MNKQSFEDFLFSKGYKKYVLVMVNKKWTFKPFTNEIVSSLSNLDYRYIHESDPIIDKINNNTPITEGGITFEDRKGEICWGLNELGKPPVLIYPRPRIIVKRLDENGHEIYEDQRRDDSMFIAAKEKTNEEIFEAMFDRTIIFEFDLTKNICTPKH